MKARGGTGAAAAGAAADGMGAAAGAFRRLRTRLGDMEAAATSAGLCALRFAAATPVAPRAAAAAVESGGGAPEPDGAGTLAAGRHLDDAERQLDEYLRGRRRRFEIALALDGTSFQERVWRALLEIPYGDAISYAELARRVGSPGASRAVGSANGCNPVAIVVPCHRVVRADGGLGGYAGGVERKRALLVLEGGGPGGLFATTAAAADAKPA